jgi:hypothetical protein
MDQESLSTPAAARPRAKDSIAGDVLYGADGIAAYLYGDATQRRKIYNLVETERLPHFRLGALICARKSILLGWIADQEKAAVERGHAWAT